MSENGDAPNKVVLKGKIMIDLGMKDQMDQDLPISSGIPSIFPPKAPERNLCIDQLLTTQGEPKVLHS